MNSDRRRTLAWAILIGVVTTGALLVARAPSHRSPQAGDAPVPTETFILLTEPPVTLEPHPAILTSAAAISVTLEMLPQDVSPNAIVARLLTYEVADAWRDFSGSAMDRQAPVWAVAVVAKGLSPPDVLLGLPTENSDEFPASSPGVFYLWDANSGFLAGRGMLDEVRSYASLSQLPDQPLSISQATDPPSLPTADPEETPAGD